MIHKDLSSDLSLLLSLMKRLQKRRSADFKTVIILDFIYTKETNMKELTSLIQKEGFEVAIKLDSIHITEIIRLLDIVNYISIDDSSFDMFKYIHQSIKRKVIYHHQGRNLLKSEMQELSIQYLYGNLYSYINM